MVYVCYFSAWVERADLLLRFRPETLELSVEHLVSINPFVIPRLNMLVPIIERKEGEDYDILRLHDRGVATQE